MHYQPDLAYIHDTGFDQLARAAAGVVADLLPPHHAGNALVVDLGCGSGTLAEHISRQGYRVLGVDYSPDMLDIARKKVPGAEFQCGSFVDVPIPPCQAVTAIGEVFNYQFDPNSSPDALAQVLCRIHAALAPGGYLVFDFISSGILGPVPKSVRLLESADWSLFLDYSEDLERCILTRNITIFRKTGKLYRRSHEVHTLNLYEPTGMETLLRQAGFQNIAMSNQYGALRLRDKNFAVIAQK